MWEGGGVGGGGGFGHDVSCSLVNSFQLRSHYLSPPLLSSQLKDFASAIRDYTKAHQIDPTNAYAFYNRGISHDRNGDFNRAIDDFTAAIRLLPHNADFYHNRGFCFRKKVCLAQAFVQTLSLL